MWKGGSGVVICAECGKSIMRPRYDIDNRSERFFCNLKCRGKWMSENMSGTNHRMYEGNYLKTKCTQCGKSLEIENWRASRAKKFFCNYRCMGDWQAENLTGNARYNWKGGRFPYYGPNWQRQRKAARKRDGDKCQYCGMTKEEHMIKFNQELHVHHIKPFRDFDYKPKENDNYKLANSLNNLITLCNTHHRLLESGKISIDLV